MDYKKRKIEAELLYRYITNRVDEYEREYVEEWLKNEENWKFFLKFTDETHFYAGVSEMLDADTNMAYYLLSKKIEKAKRRNFFIRVSSVAAIALISLMICFSYFNKSEDEIVFVENIVLENKEVTLHTYEGETVAVEKKQNESLLKSCGMEISKKKDALVCAANSNENENQVIQYNTLEIPKGKEFFIVLCDGTKVWLNSNTIFRFPSDFTGDTRKVYLEGEAFFEVTKSKSKKFIVESVGTDITVLGTSFNVNCYDSKELYTTLLEGSVKVSKGKNFKIISPGQQAIISNETIVVSDANVSDAVAWKYGYIVFRSATLDKIFEGLQRWYSFDFQIDDELKNKRFTTKLYKKNSLDAALKILETTGEFKIKRDGRKIILTN